MSNANRKLVRRRKNQRRFAARWVSRRAAIMALIMGVTPPSKPSKRTHAARLRQRKRAMKRFAFITEAMNQYMEPLKAFRQTVAEHLRPAFEKLATEVNEAFRFAPVDNNDVKAIEGIDYIDEIAKVPSDIRVDESKPLTALLSKRRIAFLAL